LKGAGEKKIGVLRGKKVKNPVVGFKGKKQKKRHPPSTGGGGDKKRKNDKKKVLE